MKRPGIETFAAPLVHRARRPAFEKRVTDGWAGFPLREKLVFSPKGYRNPLNDERGI